MANGLSRTDKNLERGQKLDQRLDALTQQVQKLADGQKHSDNRLDALADIVRQ